MEQPEINDAFQCWEKVSRRDCTASYRQGMSDWPMDSSYVCHSAGSVEEDDLQFSVRRFVAELLSEILLTTEEDTTGSGGELHAYVLFDGTVRN